MIRGKRKGTKKPIVFNSALVAYCCWKNKTDVHYFLDKFPIEIMRICLNTREVSLITGRESSTVRYARINGRLKGVLVGGEFFYSLWDVIHGFRPKKNVRRKWSAGEKLELKRTGTCRTRSANACKIMRCKMRKSNEVR
jgi:hypothetical protein